jgi:ubiquinone/menaquinone biosynthesis C-methylase UbiE
MPSEGWASAENASRYAEFTRRYPLYQRTSQDLVGLLALENASLVVDLACGTGATTEVLLETLSDDARVIAVDGSEAMQAVARQRITDRRVSWVTARLESFDTASDQLTQVDAVICNSAIWQSDLAATFAAVRNVLRAGGGLAFNIASRFMRLEQPATPEERHVTPSLFELMHAVAVYDYGLAPPPPSGPRRLRPTVDQLGELLAAAGLRMRHTEVFEYEEPADASYAWLKVPVFTEWGFGTLPYEQRMAALDKAYRRLRELEQANGTTTRRTRWLAVVATLG